MDFKAESLSGKLQPSSPCLPFLVPHSHTRKRFYRLLIDINNTEHLFFLSNTMESSLLHHPGPIQTKPTQIPPTSMLHVN